MGWGEGGFKVARSTHLDLLHISNPRTGFSQRFLKGSDVGEQSRDILCLLNDGGQRGRGVLLPVGWRERWVGSHRVVLHIPRGPP